MEDTTSREFIDSVKRVATINNRTTTHITAGPFISSATSTSNTLLTTAARKTNYILNAFSNTLLSNVTNNILLSDSSDNSSYNSGFNSFTTTTTTRAALKNFINNSTDISLNGIFWNFTTTTDIIGTENDDVPHIPDYIRYTSMIFCIAIMCLGVIGNIMVSGYFVNYY